MKFFWKFITTLYVTIWVVCILSVPLTVAKFTGFLYLYQYPNKTWGFWFSHTGNTPDDFVSLVIKALESWRIACTEKEFGKKTYEVIYGLALSSITSLPLAALILRYMKRKDQKK